MQLKRGDGIMPILGEGDYIEGDYFCERKSLFFRYLEKIHGGG
jgi:hypothetical protein